ncbi:MAG: hypothetical protein ACTHOI_07410 [Sphingomicrobium sp.]
MLKSIVIVAATFAIAAPVGAQTPPAQTPAPAASKDKDPNRLICERQEEIGSRLGGKKVCHTAAQWDELRKSSRQQVEDWQRQNTDPGKPVG